jgi:hypothetical protein
MTFLPSGQPGRTAKQWLHSITSEVLQQQFILMNFENKDDFHGMVIAYFQTKSLDSGES